MTTSKKKIPRIKTPAEVKQSPLLPRPEKKEQQLYEPPPPEDKKSNLSIQFRHLLPVIILSVIIGLAGILLVYILHITVDVKISSLTRDVSALVNLKPIAGILSNIGVVFLTTAAAVCLFAWTLLRCEAAPQVRGEERRFMLWSGLISFSLMLDDFFMFHDYILPLDIGIPEKVVLVVYCLVALAYLYGFAKTILKTDYILLALAILFLGVSAIADQVLSFTEAANFFEDGAKFFGIVFWTAYYVVTAGETLREREI